MSTFMMPSRGRPEPTSLMTHDEAYERNFHEGHVRGREHGATAQFTQSLAAFDPGRPGFGEGYRAGYRLAVWERFRKR